MNTLFDDPPEAPPEAPPNPELIVRDHALAILERTRADLLTMLRDRMRTLYQQRRAAQGPALAYVTADDARIILDTEPGVPGPETLNRNFMGSLFNAPGWKPTGQQVRRRTDGSHGNRILCWRWEGVA